MSDQLYYNWCKELKYYNIHVQSNLFGETSVIKSWGSLNSRRAGYKITFCNSETEVDKIVTEIIKKRRARGYLPCEASL